MNSSKFLKLFKSMDLISSEVKLNFKGKTKFQSFIGASLTLIVAALTLAITIYLSISVFSFENPKVSISRNFDKNSSFLNFSEFSPIMFGIINLKGDTLQNQEKYFNVRAYSQSLQLINNKPVQILNDLKIKKCSKSVIMNEFGPFGRFMDKLTTLPSLNSYYCIPTIDNPFFFIKNPLGAIDSYSISLSAELCNNSTSSVPCKSQEEINSVIGDLLISLPFFDYYFDHNNEEPSIRQLILKPISLSSYFVKTLFINFKAVSYTTDYSLIKTNLVKKSYNQVSSISSDVSDISKGPSGQISIFEAKFAFQDNIQDKYYRSYQTLPQLLAEISGIFNFLYISAIIVNFYFDNKLKNQDVFDTFCNENLMKKAHHIGNKTIGLELQNDKVIRESPSKITLDFKEQKSYNLRVSKKQRENIIKSTQSDIITTQPKEESCIIFNFENLIEKILVEKKNLHHYRNLFFCYRNKTLDFKMSISETFYYQIFDTVFIFNNILDFLIFKRNGFKISN